MPAKRLDSQPVDVGKYEVAGLDAADMPGFVGHVGLCDEVETAIVVGAVLNVMHMAPPFCRGAHLVHVVGYAGLSVDQIQQINVFVDELALEYSAHEFRRVDKQYVIHPHVREPDADTPYRRFNCAGFVIEAYREAGIELLVTDDVPPLKLDTITTAYRSGASLLERPRWREEMGLTGDGPWPVVLAGYVINALDRPEDEIRSAPYVAAAGDEFFPPRRG